MIGRTDFTYCENFKKNSPKQIEGNQNQSQITTCERTDGASMNSRRNSFYELKRFTIQRRHIHQAIGVTVCQFSSTVDIL